MIHIRAVPLRQLHFLICIMRAKSSESRRSNQCKKTVVKGKLPACRDARIVRSDEAMVLCY